MLDGTGEERKEGCRSREKRESLFLSIITGGELLNWELELERISKTLQIQLHLKMRGEGGE